MFFQILYDFRQPGTEFFAVPGRGIGRQELEGLLNLLPPGAYFIGLARSTYGYNNINFVNLALKSGKYPYFAT
jgi:hypothetical protein